LTRLVSHYPVLIFLLFFSSCSLDSEEDLILGVCAYVEANFTYTLEEDTYQTPGETRRRGAGDCEDFALLIAQMLKVRGIESRLVTGHTDGLGHMVVEVDGVFYDRHGIYDDLSFSPFLYQTYEEAMKVARL
jgi:transglutaminase-like putative cysteine protease